MTFSYSFVFLVYMFIFISGCLSKKLTCNEVSEEEPVKEFLVDFHLCTPSKAYCQKINSSMNLKAFLKYRRFDPNIKTAILVHGFLHDHEIHWVRQMKYNLMKWV